MSMSLVEAARRGGEAEFLRLFEEHHLPLFRFAYRLTGSAADAEDVVQECFLELLRPGCGYDPRRTPIRTYLFGAVRNQSLKRRAKANPAADRLEIGEDWTPESRILQAELADAVAEAVRQLPQTQREILILAHYEQMPLAEIARVMDLSVAAVKSRLERARARLKEELARYAPVRERKT
jgi:RNA polymerase sigma-70 factor (ECF subfamily)